MRGAAQAAALAAALSASSVARAEEASTALIHDLERLVEGQSSTGWIVDRYEYEAIMNDALHSVCQTTEATRAVAAARLAARVGALGGPVGEAYRRSGRDLDAIGDLLFASRVAGLLTEARRRAPAECPVWLEPTPAFNGVQTDAGRFVIVLEGGGLLLLHVDGGKLTPGGGGSGRMLFGYGIDHEWSFLLGPEFGGAALFKQSETGTELPIQFTLAAPIVLRRHDLTWLHDLELSPLAAFTGTDNRLSYGVRVGGLLGLSTVRIRRIMPWAGVGVAFEYFFKNPTRDAFAGVKGGLRIGFDWDF